MRRRKNIPKFIAIILLMSVIAVAYIFFMSVEDTTEKRSKKTTEDYTHFISFCDRNRPNWLSMINSSMTTLNYFQNHIDDLVTDAAVGTRIMEGSVFLLLCKLHSLFGINSSFAFQSDGRSTDKCSVQNKAKIRHEDHTGLTAAAAQKQNDWRYHCTAFFDLYKYAKYNREC
ncbi:hypothetical protein HA402_012857 [Bradysia odoriphaga]|nr:hypothetical protein HA402_012857 [Bradysia odoriphaga]